MLPQKTRRRMRRIEAAIHASTADDPFFPLSFSHLLRRKFAEADVLDMFDGECTTLDELLAAIFPGYGREPLNADAPTDVQRIPVRVKGFEKVRLNSPLKWHAGEKRDRLWRLLYTGLDWLPELACQKGGARQAGKVILDYHDFLLSRALPVNRRWDSFTWGDHAIAIRGTAVFNFLRLYVHQPEAANREVIVAAFQILLIQVCAMLNDSCYTSRHNHGLFQDLSLLLVVGRLPGLRRRDDILAFAAERVMQEQVYKSVSDGMHIENSPTYHLLFMKILLRCLSRHGLSDKNVLHIRSVFSDLTSNFLYLVFPDRTIVPVGDTARQSIADDMASIRKSVSEGSGSLDHGSLATVIDHLSGREDIEPELPPRAVFPDVGYASFRSSWSTDATMALLKCGSASGIHKHQDDGSVQVYGLGQELILDPAKFANDRTLPESEGSHMRAAHSLLNIGIEGATPLASSIVGFDGGARPWVLCRSAFEGSRQHRLLLMWDDRRFVIVDVVDAEAQAESTIQFLLHPALKILPAEPGTKVRRATRSDGEGLRFSPIPVVAKGLAGKGAKTSFERRAHFHPGLRKREDTTMLCFDFPLAAGVNVSAILIEIGSGASLAAAATTDMSHDRIAVSVAGERVSVPAALESREDA